VGRVAITIDSRENQLVVNKPVGGNARKGAMKKAREGLEATN
jgi:hypothetical protein